MEDHDQNRSRRNPPAAAPRKDFPRRRSAEDDHVACTWKSCTAGAIADCVAVCCCPCGVVSILVLAFVKLPWAVARRCIGRRRRAVEGKRDMNGIMGKGRVEAGKTETVASRLEEELNYHFSPGFKIEDDGVWIELYEFGHWGFGRLSFTGIPFQNKAN